MPDYKVRIPIEVYGSQELRQVTDAIRGVSGATQGLSRDMQEFVRNAREEVNVSLSLDKALREIRSGATGASEAHRQLASQLQGYINRAREAEAETQRLNNAFGRFEGRVLGQELFGRIGVPGGGRLGGALFGSALSGPGAPIIGGALIGGFAIAELIKIAEQTAKYAQEQHNLAAETGLSVEQVQRFGQISEVTGVKASTLFSHVNRLNDGMTKGGEEAKKIERALQQMGLSASTAFETPDRQLSHILGALRNVSDQAERTRLIVNLFGDSGRQLLPLVDTFDDATRSVREFGRVLGPEATAQLAKFRQESQEIALAWDAIKQKLSETIVAKIEWVTGGSPGRFTQQATGFTGAIGSIAGAFTPFGPIAGLIAAARGGVAASGREPNDYDLTEGSKVTDELNVIRQRQIESARRAGQNPVERLRAELRDLQQQQQDAAKSAQNLNDVTSIGRVQSLGGQIRAKEEQIRNAEKFQNQSRRFQELSGREFRFDPPVGERAIQLYGQLPREFFRLTGTADYQRQYQSIGAEAFRFFGQEDFRFRAQDDIRRQNKDFEDQIREQRDQEQDARAQLRVTLDQLGGANDIDAARRRQSVAIEQGARITARQGFAVGRRGGGRLTPVGEAQRELEEARREIAAQDAARRGLLTGQAGAYETAAQAFLPGSPQRDELLAEAQKKRLDLEALDIDTKTKSIEAVNKFNEAIDKAAEQMRDQFASGFESIILGAQRGGGRGARQSVISFFEGQEATILRNLGGELWRGGVGSIFGTAGKAIPPWLSQGTIFGQQGEPIKLNTDQLKAVDNTITAKLIPSLDGLHAAIVSSTIRYGGAAAGGGPIISVPLPGGGSVPIPLGVGGGSGGGVVSVPLPGGGSIPIPISSISAVAPSIAAAASNPSASSIVSALTGTARAGLNAFGDRSVSLPGFSAATTLSSLVSSGVLAAAGGTTLAAGLNTGGARGGFESAAGVAGIASALPGLAGLFGIASPILSALGPIGAIAGPALGLIASLFGDPKQQRAKQIEKELFTSQYIAPPSISLSVGPGGGYSDVDIYGNVRSTNFSPYPQSSAGYLDVPRRTVVPGHTYSSFGGPTGAPSAQTPQNPTYITIHAMDSESLHGYLQRNARTVTDAVHTGIREGYHPVVNELRQQIGS